MKKYKLILVIAAVIGLGSCSNDFLTVQPTDSQATGGAATEGAILSNLASCYQILTMDSYANYNYNSIPFMSDLRSDDIYKGGGNAGDQMQLYLLSQFNSDANQLPSGIWNIYYKGISRCNNVILACDHAVDVPAAKLAQYQAEAHFLRAYYTHWIWKFWGNIPYFEADLPAPYMAKQLTADEIYTKIIADVNFAIDGNKLPMRVTAANDGRVSQAAAIMLKSRVVMYQKDATLYPEVLAQLNTIVTSNAYKLVDYAGIWLQSGEFCDESIFESNQLPMGRDWGSPFDGYGTNLPAFISPSELKSSQLPFTGGWGFGPVRQATWNLFEAGDVRKVASINSFPAGSYSVRFQDTGLWMAKYASRDGYNPPPANTSLNYSNNFRIFRYAEALLNIADLITIEGVSPGSGITAQSCLDQIRTRAGLTSIAATKDNVKLERRREFVGEGLRFWDLVRWGDTSLLTENDAAHQSVRTWADFKKYLPIPQSEIDKTKGNGDFELHQNTGY